MSTLVVAGARQEWSRRVCGLTVLRRQVLAAQKERQEPITVVCAPEDLEAVNRELAGTRATIEFEPAPSGATLRLCSRFDGEALIRSVYKPTDNALARLNRRVSIPISRVLCRIGISPNAITIIGLFLSLLCGIAYAAGTYEWMLAGAFLSWFSSMWDGCDGEVARLTYRESEFGCWLESVCDDIYYAAVFVGMTIGTHAYGLGAFALVGALLTIALHYALRASVAARTGAAASFARYFERRMILFESDPLVRFARATWKLGTRSTLPYLLFALALVGQTRAALVIVAAGTHLYWMLSLYIWTAEPAPRRVPPLPLNSEPRRA